MEITNTYKYFYVIYFRLTPWLTARVGTPVTLPRSPDHPIPIGDFSRKPLE